MTGPEPTRRPGGGDTDAVVVAFLVAFVISIALVVVTPAPGSLDRLAAPPAGPDRVPEGPIIEAVPEGCGVSPATVGRLVAESRTMMRGPDGECSWSSGADGVSRRMLSVNVILSEGTAAGPMTAQAAGRAPVAAAMRSFGPRWSDVTTRAVTGLGDEALAQFSPSTGSTVVTRVGNAKVIVRYSDVGPPMPEETARSGAFTAAAEVVGRLGVRTPSRPAIAPAAPRSPGREIPDLCGAVSERTLHRLVKGEEYSSGRESGEGELAVKGADRRGCTWMSMEQVLTVSAAVVPGTELSDGTRLAVREYEMRHDDARAEDTLSVHDRKIFRPVTGLGDQAFAAHVPGVVPGLIVFRDGELLVQVTYEENDERHPLSGKHAVRGAYAAAQEVAEALSVH
ncbi:hypothetical protein E1281_00735 [Actinomadura sp. KC345]|uniref:hypothetical protein n=1 Tax=Actinomadura sp. KC345 TaxID=2530371 RepID=UPI001047A1B6|nr:hypothetical protein [Actinomadura sp. KC345]TDC58666.1 hypothetical protein E1281_00735 [Actinomadura sp. KC345]